MAKRVELHAEDLWAGYPPSGLGLACEQMSLEETAPAEWKASQVKLYML